MSDGPSKEVEEGPSGAGQGLKDEDLAFIQQYLQQNMTVGQEGEEGGDEEDGWVDTTGGILSGIHSACEAGDASSLAEMLEAHPDIDLNLPGTDGDTALNLASLYGHLDVVKLLLQRGAKASTVNPEDGSTALHDAAAGGYLEIAQLLLENSAESISVADEDGDTPLHNAARGNHAEMVKLLLSKGADKTLKNADGNTPAKEADEDDVISLLK